MVGVGPKLTFGLILRKQRERNLLELIASRGLGWSHGPELALGWQLKGVSRGLGSRTWARTGLAAGVTPGLDHA